MKIHTRIGLTLRIFSSGMAADMITTEMIKIQKDFNERFADLQKQKKQSERRDALLMLKRFYRIAKRQKTL